MRGYLVAGNWKMHGSRDGNRALVEGIVAGIGDVAGVDVLVCPPFPYLAEVAGQVAGSGLLVGAQNLATETSGAFTGEVSGDMLVDSGCRYVIVGHSERRALYGESSAIVAVKFGAARDCGLGADSLRRRDPGRKRGWQDQRRHR